MSKTIYISYATPDYMPRLRKMVKSLIEVGIPKSRIDVSEATIAGNWYHRVKAKIEFMQRACDEYPDNNLCWIDADAVVVKYPEFFEEFNAEWGMAREPRGGAGKTGRWFLSNAYIIRPTVKSRFMLQKWHEHTIPIQSRTPTQTAFNQAWEKYMPELKLHFQEVPLSYCWYEKHKHREPYRRIDPVIIHDIASRKTLLRR